MGTLYFVVKNTIVTIVVVTLMQVSLLGKTIEDRVMNFVRGNFAVKFLGTEHISLNENSLELSPKQITEIRKRFGESAFMKMIKTQATEMMKEELKSLKANPSALEKELEKMQEDQNRLPAHK